MLLETKKTVSVHFEQDYVYIGNKNLSTEKTDYTHVLNEYDLNMMIDCIAVMNIETGVTDIYVNGELKGTFQPYDYVYVQTYFSVYGNKNTWISADILHFSSQYYDNKIKPIIDNCLIRVHSGGCAYNDNGYMSLIDKGQGGWPIFNEWDKYLVNNDFEGKITPGDPSIWNSHHIAGDTFTIPYTICKETTVNGGAFGNITSANNTHRINRGRAERANFMNCNAAFSASNTTGFRPVLIFREDGKFII